MDERTVKNRITQAMAEPRAPEALVSSTIRRASAITMGRRAEQRLDAGGDIPRTEKVGLYAASLIGRMAAAAPLPDGPTPEEMAGSLARQPRFQEAVAAPNALQRIRSGELLQELTAGAKTAPVREAPVKTAPARSGPSR